MQKVIIQPRAKLSQLKRPREIWKIWERAKGIWAKKKPEPIKYLKKLRKEWERKFPYSTLLTRNIKGLKKLKNFSRVYLKGRASRTVNNVMRL